MANQYSGSFEHLIRRKFSCTAKELLVKFSEDGVTYQEAEKILGFKHGTIRKWAARFGINLNSTIKAKPIKSDSFMKKFRQKGINQYNVLSRNWGMQLKIAFV